MQRDDRNRATWIIALAATVAFIISGLLYFYVGDTDTASTQGNTQNNNPASSTTGTAGTPPPPSPSGPTNPN